jgi:ferrous iron transport protein B
LIWALGYFPRDNEESNKIEQSIQVLKEKKYQSTHNLQSVEFQNGIQMNIDQQIDSLTLTSEKIKRENSYIGMIGKSVEPIMAPLGFDWKMTVSIITGIAAKEVVVSTLGVLYQADTNADENSQGLKMALQEDKHFSKTSALSFLLFVLIYFPCIAVIAAVKKETGHWKWAFFMIGYTTLLAWLLSFIVYQLGNWLY